MASSTERERRKPAGAFAVATSLGLGYVPKAPGTLGSAAAVLLVAATAAITRNEIGPGILVSEFMLTLALAIFGLWSSQRVAIYTDDPDPQYVVIDELSGQALALLGGLALRVWTTPPGVARPNARFAPLLSAGLLSWKYLLAGYILFRVFDIWKPFPARRAESLPGGLGIMADDWIAGAYAALGLWLARYIGL